jgi:hypothetical protein
MRSVIVSSGLLLATALLSLYTLADGQSDGSVFVQGRIDANATGLTITADSDHSVLRIENPEIFDHPGDHRVILHGTLTKNGVRAISAATIDDPKDPLGIALVEMAGYRQDVVMVAHLLQLGSNPNAKTPDGSPALVEAIEKGVMRWGAPPSLEITTALLDHGADPNATDQDGETPLMAAGFTGNDKVVKVLLDHQANVNAKDKYGLTPLMDARRLPVVRLLLSAGASVEDKDKDGETALHHAAGEGDPDVVKALIDASANVNAKNKEGISALHIARKRLENLKSGRDKSRFQRVIEVLVASGAA